jgi:hypothetical protein
MDAAAPRTAIHRIPIFMDITAQLSCAGRDMFFLR